MHKILGRYRRHLLEKKIDQRLPGFSLIELGLVLLIIGIVAGAVFKGQDLLLSSKLNSVLDDVRRYKQAVIAYQQDHGEWPGDDAKASQFFPNAQNGNGNGLVEGNEEVLAWRHLQAAGHVAIPSPPASRFGGTYRLSSVPIAGVRGLHLILGQGPQGRGALFTPSQAQSLKNKAGDGSVQEGFLKFVEGEGMSPGKCHQGERFSVEEKEPTCILLVPIL